jgi:acyl-homoserine-lactone acylase
MCSLQAIATAAERAETISRRVTITRDDWGIAHVRGRSDADAVFGAIYAQAEDDFPRIEANYLNALGRAAEAEGEGAIWRDLRQRLFVDPEDLKAKYAASPGWLRKLMDAWAAGLNHYLATHPEVTPKVIRRFEPWMALAFTEGSIGGDIERVNLEALRAFYETALPRELAMRDDLAFAEPAGSNGFAIAPSNTQAGRALLLINPHTSFYFRSELQMTSDEGLDAYGAVTWGQFFIYQGFNARAGWMHTSTSADNVDEFAETIIRRPDGLRYRYGAEERPVTASTLELRYRTADGRMATRRFTLYRTHHGPIVRAEGDRWIAAAMMNRPVAALQQSYLRTKAQDLAGYRRIAALKANSSNNTLFADAKGEVAFLMPQFMPRRDDRFDYTKPVDGSDPATDWQGLHALEELPKVTSPPNGWIFNVNDGPYDAAGPYSPQAGRYPRYMDVVGRNARTPQAQRVLTARTDFTLETLVDAAYDPYLPTFAELVPGLISAFDAAADPRLAGPVAALKAWDYRWSADSVPTSLAVFWGEALWERRRESARSRGVSVYRAMADASPETRLAALREAVARLETDFGSWRTPWGRINRLQRNDGAVVQTFDDAKASLPIPFTSAQWGSLASFGARRQPGTKRYYGASGNSFVAAVEFGPRVRALAVNVGGASGDPSSPHFRDQDLRFAQGRPREVYFYPDQLLGHVESRYRPGQRRPAPRREIDPTSADVATRPAVRSLP